VKKWIFRNGIYQPTPDVTCTDGLIIAAEEELLRRHCDNINHYIHSKPDFSGLPVDFM